MNLDKLQLWIDALESGNYPQGHKRLVTLGEDGTKQYCCLGVVCDLAIADGINMDRRVSNFREYFDEESATLPEAAQLWLGSDDNPNIFTTSTNARLVATLANDELNMDFKMIAGTLRHTFFGEPLPENFPSEEIILNQINN